MNKTVFREILTMLAEDAFPTEPDAWRVFSAKLGHKMIVEKENSLRCVIRRRPAILSAGLTLVILLSLIVLFLTPRIQVFTAEFLRFFHPAVTQTQPAIITSTLITPSRVTGDANIMHPVNRTVSTPECAAQTILQFDGDDSYHEAQISDYEYTLGYIDEQNGMFILDDELINRDLETAYPAPNQIGTAKP